MPIIPSRDKATLQFNSINKYAKSFIIYIIIVATVKVGVHTLPQHYHPLKKHLISHFLIILVTLWWNSNAVQNLLSPWIFIARSYFSHQQQREGKILVLFCYSAVSNIRILRHSFRGILSIVQPLILVWIE